MYSNSLSVYIARVVYKGVVGLEGVAAAQLAALKHATTCAVHTLSPPPHQVFSRTPPENQHRSIGRLVSLLYPAPLRLLYPPGTRLLPPHHTPTRH